jgi:hypothetical protein
VNSPRLDEILVGALGKLTPRPLGGSAGEFHRRSTASSLPVAQ